MLKYPWDIIGHDRQLLVLEKEITEDKLAHAYLFHGRTTFVISAGAVS